MRLAGVALGITLLFPAVSRGQPSVTETNILGPLHPTVKLPPTGSPPQGFRCEIELATEIATGYLPVKITMKAVNRFAADRQLLFRFATEPGGQTPPRNGLVIDVPINVSQGTKSATFVRYLPKWSAGQAVEVSVLEDGRLLDDYVALIGNRLPRGRNPYVSWLGVEEEMNVVFVSDEDSFDPSSQRDLVTVGMAMFGQQQPSGAASFDQPKRAMIGQHQLPYDWRDYQLFDAVVLSNASAERLAENAAALNALRQWVLIGGTVVVYNIASPESTLQLLNFRWTADVGSANLIRARIEQEPALTDSGQAIWLQLAGAGQVIGIGKGPSDIPSPVHWSIVHELIGYRVSPTLRRGVDPMIGDARFRRWMIPGVAQPPVYTFMGLLTVFVLLVGPIAYRKTAKVGRSYLMFAIAPVLALITTMAMFGYGVVSDGFGTVVRVRQLTFVDGRSGDAGERVQATYFAGVRPADGLRFDGHAEVTPYPENSGRSWEEQHRFPADMLGRVVIRPDVQRLDSAFLPSRQQRQFVVHSARQSVGHLELFPSKDKDAPPMLQSTFAFKLHQVVIRDEHGNYWEATNLAGGTTVGCRRLRQAGASKLLGKIYTDHRPLSTIQQRATGRSGSRQTYDVVNEINRRIAPNMTVSDGVFETWLQYQLQTDGEIPRHYFVATADISADVLAVDGSQPVESIRHVFGTLR